jgi:hypothetical protein
MDCFGQFLNPSFCVLWDGARVCTSNQCVGP